ncbi:MAG: rRNA maturation RNase YbeY [Acidobacteria bacterium]|nr:rRNA maturation RNase YbeY [Acidobacteriota bacterium]
MTIEFINHTNSHCDEGALISLAQFVINERGVHPDSELSISCVDEDEMTSLHMQWMNEPGPTDVLSFPMDEIKPNSASNGPGLIGDIVLCPTVAAKQAESANHSAQSEMELLTAHGILHLLGYDHALPNEELAMFKLQDDLLAKWRA